jgi:hypothetical protein
MRAVNLIVVSTAKRTGQTDTGRRTVGTDRTIAAAAQGAAHAVSGAQATGRSRSAHGHSVHPAHRPALGPATTRDGLRQRRHELLAPSARLAGRWRLGPAARGSACALGAADQIDRSRVIVDSSSIRAVGAGQKRDPIPPTARDLVQSTTSSSKRRASRSR